jgi:hypothetical protein
MALQTDVQTFEAEQRIGTARAQVLVRAEALVPGAGRDAIEPLLADAGLYIVNADVQADRVVLEGTVACQAVFAWLFGKSEQLDLFTAQRLYEDAGYCGHVRKEVTALIEPLGYGYFNAGEKDGVVAGMVRQHLSRYMERLTPEIAARYELDRCQMPWKRMFEVDLTLKRR